MRPKAQPHPRQDSQQSKDVLADRPPKGDRADSASPRDGFAGLRPDAGRANRNDKGDSGNAPAATCGLVREAWRGSSIKQGRLGVSVNRPS